MSTNMVNMMNTQRAKDAQRWLGLVIGLVIVGSLAVTSLFAAIPIVNDVPTLAVAVNETPLLGSGTVFNMANYHIGTLIVAVVLWALGLTVALSITLMMDQGQSRVINSYSPRDNDPFDRPDIKQVR